MVLALLQMLTLETSQFDAARYTGKKDFYKTIASSMFNQLDMPYEALNTTNKTTLDALGASFYRPATLAMFDYFRDTAVLTSTTLGDVKDSFKNAVPSQVSLLASSTQAFQDIAYGGNIIAVAAGTEGLFVYSRDGVLIQQVPVGDFAGPATSINSVTIHPTKPWIVVGATGGATYVYAIDYSDYSVDWGTIEVAPLAVAPAAQVETVRFSPDGKQLAYAGPTVIPTVVNVDIAASSLLAGAWAKAYDSSDNSGALVIAGVVGHVAWRPDSSGIAFLSSATNLNYLDAFATTAIGGGTGGVVAPTAGDAVAFNYDGTVLGLVDDTDLELIDATGSDTTKWPLIGSAVALGAAGSELVAHPSKNIFATFDGTNVTTVVETSGVWEVVAQTAPIATTATTGIAFNTDGTALYASGTDAGTYLKVSTSNIDQTTWSVSSTLRNAATLAGRRSALSSNNLLAVQTAADVITIFDVSKNQQKVVGEINTFTTAVTALDWSHDGLYLFATDGTTTASRVHAFAASTFDGSAAATDTVANLEIGTAPLVANGANDSSTGETATSIAISNVIGNTYYVAVGVTLGAAATEVGIYYNTFNGTAWGGANLATNANKFGQHLYTTSGTESVYVASDGATLVTSSKGPDRDSAASDNAHLLRWTMNGTISAPASNLLSTYDTGGTTVDTVLDINGTNVATSDGTNTDLIDMSPAVATLTDTAALVSTSIKFSSDGTQIATTQGTDVLVYTVSGATTFDTATATHTLSLGALSSVDWFEGSTTNLIASGANGTTIVKDYDTVSQAIALAVAKFTGTTDSDTYQSLHLFHPESIAQQQASSLDISLDKVDHDIANVLKSLRRLSSEDFLDRDICDRLANKARDCFAGGLTKVARDHGLDAATYTAKLAYPDQDETRRVARSLAGGAFDFASNSTLDDAILRLEGGLVHTRALRKLAQPHGNDFTDRAMAQEAVNTIERGQKILDWSGAQLARKAGAFHASANYGAWSADGKYYAIATNGLAAPNTGLLIYNRDHNLVKRYAPSDFGGTAVRAIAAHPIEPWLIVATESTVRVINLDDFTIVSPLNFAHGLTNITSLAISNVADTTTNNEGSYYVAISESGAAPIIIKIPGGTDSLTASTWIDDTASWNGGMALTAALDNGFAWNHQGDNLMVAYHNNNGGSGRMSFVTKATEFDIVFGNSIESYSFNYNDTKFAITRGTLAGDVRIYNSILSSPASWTIMKTFEYDSASPAPAKFSKLAFHPSVDLLAAAAYEGDLSAENPPLEFGELNIFDLRAPSTANWVLVQQGVFAEPVMLENTGTRTTSTDFALSWNKDGSRLLVANGSAGGKDHKGEAVVFNASLSNFNWKRSEANADYSEALRLTTGVMDQLRLDPDDATNKTNATNVLKGGDWKADTDYSTANALVDEVKQSFEDTAVAWYQDVLTAVPIKATKDLREAIESNKGAVGNEIAAKDGGLFDGTNTIASAIYENNLVATVTSAALHGVPYKVKASGTAIAADAENDIPAPPAVFTLASKLTIGKDVTNAASTILPEGSLEALAGRNLTLGSYRTIGSKLDSLVAAIKAPNGLLNGSDYGSIKQSQKDAVERAYVLRALMTNDDTTTLNSFFTTNATNIKAVIAEVVPGNFTTYTPTGVTGVDFVANTTRAVRQEIAAIAVLYIDDGTVGATAGVQDVIAAAYNAATLVKDLGVPADKAEIIRKELAVLGGIGAATLLAETVPAGETAQVGTELARGLLLNEHTRNLVIEDLGTSGHDGLSLDLSDKMIAAVGACIVAEARATKDDLSTGSGTGTDEAANVGSFAVPLAQGQIFEDDLYRAIAKAAEQSRETTEHVIALSDDTTAPEITTNEKRQVARVARENLKDSLSRRRDRVKRMYAGNPNSTPVGAPIVTTPSVDYTFNAIVHAIGDALKNPVTTPFNGDETGVWSDASDTRSTNFAHPVRRADEIAQACGEPGRSKAVKIYDSLKADETQGDVDAAVRSVR